jgi:uncharacterized membrane protein YgcG
MPQPAPARPINLNLPPPRLPPPRPAWSNFQVPIPKPPSRWLAPWLIPDPNRQGSGIRTSGGHGGGRFFGGGGHHGGGGGCHGGGHR